jgi:hypothetical protein
VRNGVCIFFFLLLLPAANAHAKEVFRKTDKGPYGTYVLYDQLPWLLPNSIATINYNAPAEKLKFTYKRGIGYIVIAPYIRFSEEDIKAFDNFLEQGNILVLSTYFLDAEMEKWLNVKVDITMLAPPRDSIKIFDMDHSDYGQFHSGKFFQSYISRYDSSASNLQILGKYSNGMINFICFKKANGFVVLQTQPYMFSNYHLIRKRTKAYSEIFFSSLPGPITSVIWDEYTKSSSGLSSEFSALGFIMKKPPLRNAFWWAFAGLLLVVFFSFRRRQRIIPALPPLSNNSLDMVRTVSDMYFFSHRNEVMAKKKIAHWLEFLRVKYNIFTTQSPDAFWQTVKMRSNISDEKMAALRTMVETFRNGDQPITDTELIHLNNLVDSFYTA